LGGVGAERRTGLVEAERAQQVALEEARLARHLAALCHLPRRPPTSFAASIEADAGQVSPGGFRKWRGNRDQLVKCLHIAQFSVDERPSARTLRTFGARPA